MQLILSLAAVGALIVSAAYAVEPLVIDTPCEPPLHRGFDNR